MAFLDHVLCSKSGLCSLLGLTIDGFSIVLIVVAICLAVIALSTCLCVVAGGHSRLLFIGVAAAWFSWLLVPRDGRAYPTLPAKCHNPALPPPTKCRVALLLTVTICPGGPAVVVRRGDWYSARCDGTDVARRKTRLATYRRAVDAWLRYTSLDQIYIVESSGWPFEELLGEWRGAASASGYGLNATRKPAKRGSVLLQRRQHNNHTASILGGGSSNGGGGGGRVHVFQYRQSRGTGSSGGEARSLLLAGRRFRRAWARDGITHVIKITGKYYLPEMEEWVKSFERCGCPADMLHSGHSKQRTPLRPALKPLTLIRSGTGDAIQCEVFGLRREALEPFYSAYLEEDKKARQSGRSSPILEEYIRKEVRDTSKWRRQLAMPRLTNALEARRGGDGSLLAWLR